MEFKTRKVFYASEWRYWEDMGCKMSMQQKGYVREGEYPFSLQINNYARKYAIEKARMHCNEKEYEYYTNVYLKDVFKNYFELIKTEENQRIIKNVNEFLKNSNGEF